MTIQLANTPVIETERLTLRAPQGSDYPAWEAFAMSERARYIGGPYSLRTSWRAFGHVIGHWAMRGFGSFVFTARGEDRPIGMAGPWYPRDWPETEIGWTVWDPAAEGKGYAFEAASAARDYAYRVLGWTTAVSYIDEPNARSIALAERLGAVRDTEAAPPNIDPADHPEPILVFRHPAPRAAE